MLKVIGWTCFWLFLIFTFTEYENRVPPQHEGGHLSECVSEKNCLMTTSQLSNVYQTTGGRIMLLSVLSYIFDVSRSPENYAKKGAYGYLTGKEATRCLATMFERDGVEGKQTLNDLNNENWDELYKWVTKINNKYEVVGRLTDWNPGMTLSEINTKTGMSLSPIDNTEYDAL